MGFLAPLLSLFGGGGLAGIFGGGIFGQIFGKIISFAFSSLLGGKKQSGPSIADRGLTQMVKQAIVEREIVYGRIRKSGPVVYLATTDDNNKYLHMIVVLASHTCEDVEELYIDDIKCTWDKDGTGELSNDELKNDDGNINAWAYYKLGAPGQTAFSELVNATSGEDDDKKWTSAHDMAGMCCVYIKLKWDPGTFSNGLPNVSAVVKGKNDIYDPRTSSTAYTDNAALCILDYMSAKYQASTEALRTPIGLGITTDEWDATSWSTEADICDELVALTEGGNEKRYTCNGVINTLDEQSSILDALLTSCVGKITYRGGKYYMLTGVYRTPTVTISEENILSDIVVAVKQSRADVFNGVKGTYITESNEWQASDFPPVKSDVFKAEDSDERIWQDIELNFTTSAATCQRIAKILLFAMRQQINVNFMCTLEKGMQIAVGDVILMSDDNMGWTSKPFEVVGWDLISDDKKGIATEIVLRETAPAVYEWSSGEESTIDQAPNTNLPTARIVTAPTSVVADSGTDQLLVDGSTVISRIGMSWDLTNDEFVRQGGEVHLQYKKASEDNWDNSGIIIIPGYRSYVFLNPVEDGIDYDIRVRFRNFTGTVSPWTYVYNHTVVGKSAPPNDVQNLIIDQNGAFVTMKWDEVTDIDLDSYQLRIGTPGDSTWTTSPILVKRLKSNLFTTSTLPAGSHTIYVKAKDTTGNFSNISASRTINVVQGVYTTDTSINLAENGWVGTFDSMIYDAGNNSISPDTITDASEDVEGNDNAIYVDRASYTWPIIDLGSDKNIRVSVDLNMKKSADTTIPIEPEIYIKAVGGSDPSAAFTTVSQSILSETGSFNNMVLHHTNKLIPESTLLASDDDIMDEFCKSQATSCYYTSPEYDLGDDAIVSLEVDVDSVLGPSETGTANVEVQVSYRTAAGSYNTFSQWSGGSFTARYFKIRLLTDGTEGKTVINSAAIEVDNFKRFTGVGEFSSKRYVQIKLTIDTSKGVSYCKDYDITIDTL